METKIYKVKSPDGSIVKVQGPVGASQDEVIRQAQQLTSNQQAAQKKADRIENRTWGGAVKEGLINIPKSAVGVAKNIGTAILNPIDTAEGVADVARGYGIDNDLFGMADNYTDEEVKEYTDKSDNMSQMIKDRYGSEQAWKNTLATDPFGLGLDLTGVGGVARQAGRLAGKAGRVGNAIGKATDFVDPISNLGGGVKAIGRGAGALVDSATARVGSQAFGGALTAGADAAQSFLTRRKSPSKGFVEQMRGKGDFDDASIVALAKDKLLEAQKSKNSKYSKGMGEIAGIKVSGAFDELNTIIKKTKDDFARTAGEVTDPAMMKFITDMEKRVNYFKKKPKLHTIEGLNKLKQNLQGIVEGVPFEKRAMRTAGSSISRGVDSAISKANPKYRKVMADYANDANMVNSDFGKTLSLTPKATIDATLRKLTSVTRNNVNTNFGGRLKSVQSLDEFGEAGSLIPQIIGNTFKGYAPRSIGLPTAGVGAAGAVATGVASVPMAAAFLMAQSPRVIGEILYKIGQTGGIPARMLDLLATNPKFTQIIAPYLNRQQDGLEQ